jgi:hypothetical protein
MAVTVQRIKSRGVEWLHCLFVPKGKELNMTPEASGQPPVTFTIDGVEYTSIARRRPAAELLELATLDPAEHDLARVVGQGQVEKRFADDEEVQLTPGAKFVSIFTGPTPVV